MNPGFPPTQGPASGPSRGDPDDQTPGPTEGKRLMLLWPLHTSAQRKGAQGLAGAEE